MRRLLVALSAALVLASSPVEAAPDPRIESSSNVRLLTSAPIRWDGDFSGSAMAAEGDSLFVGTPGSGRALSAHEPLRPGGFIAYRLTEGPPFAKQVATFACPSSMEGALSVWQGLLVQSVDPVDPLSNVGLGADAACSSPAPGGLRVVDVRDAARPRQVGFAPMTCGARNQALIPAGGAAYIFTLKDACHESVTSTELGSARLRVLKLQRTAAGGIDLRLASEIVLPASVECQGWSVLMRTSRAVCYGRSRLALFDIADPANPDLLGLGVVPGEVFHGAAFTPDGRRLITTSAVTPDECSGSDDAVGVVRTFAVEDLAAPGTTEPRTLRTRSTFSIPRTRTAQQTGGAACSSVTVTVVPGRAGKTFAAVGWNSGGMTVLDVTDEKPRELAHFASTFETQPETAVPGDRVGLSLFSGIRRAVWYRGRVYAPELMDRLGLRVLEVEGLGVGDVARQPRSYNPQTQGG